MGSIFQQDSIVLGPASTEPNKNRFYCTWTYQHWIMPLVAPINVALHLLETKSYEFGPTGPTLVAPINVALHLLGTKSFESGPTGPNIFEFRCLNLVRPTCSKHLKKIPYTLYFYFYFYFYFYL